MSGVRTSRQLAGEAGEAAAADYLAGRGWRIVGRNVRIGRDEIDILAVDPGPPPVLVAVEVRSASSAAFGSPEDRVPRVKVAHLYRAAGALRRAGGLHDKAVEKLPMRIDLVVIDRRAARQVMRHLRGVRPD